MQGANAGGADDDQGQAYQAVGLSPLRGKAKAANLLHLTQALEPGTNLKGIGAAAKVKSERERDRER